MTGIVLFLVLVTMFHTRFFKTPGGVLKTIPRILYYKETDAQPVPLGDNWFTVMYVLRFSINTTRKSDCPK